MHTSNTENREQTFNEKLDARLGAIELASIAVAIIMACVAVVCIVFTIKYVWQDTWKLPAPFKSATNDEIIKETKKCEEAGLDAYMKESLFHNSGIGCYPQKEVSDE